MTDGPQQPYHPNEGWTAPPGQQGAPEGTGDRRQVLRGQIVGGPDHQPQRPAWTPPADWSPPVPGQGTRGPSQPQSTPPAGNEPDWSALADEAEAGARRRRLLLIGGGVLAVAAVAGIVATAVVTSGSPEPSPTETASAPASEVALPPEPSFSEVSPGPTYGPLDFLSTAAKDTAPLAVGTLFPGKKLDWVDGRTYTKTRSAENRDCAAGATGSLSAALSGSGCTRMMRVTYTRGGSAVTVGVAVFKDAASAKKLARTNKFVRPLGGGGVGDFCHAVACWSKSGAVGRYAYFTISGPKNGTAATSSDTASRQAGQDGFNYAFNRIVQRGKEQADAAMAAAAASPAN
ncbi:hypothetical protein [Streptomyces sp. NPDC026673]|uniref:hypothetical protein n=1 Tax=Streptomyces sp. NPDC026673 TaxID=3155724 RepID=UPI0033E86148